MALHGKCTLPALPYYVYADKAPFVVTMLRSVYIKPDQSNAITI